MVGAFGALVQANAFDLAIEFINMKSAGFLTQILIAETLEFIKPKINGLAPAGRAYHAFTLVGDKIITFGTIARQCPLTCTSCSHIPCRRDVEPNLTPSVALTLVVSAISDLTTSTKPCLILFEPSSLDRGVVPNP